MGNLQVGIARRTLNPPPGTLLFGYGSERKGGVADDIAVTALVLRSGEKTAAILSFDWCLIDAEETASMRKALSEATGIQPADITLHMSHTHSAPMTVKVWGWGDKNRDYLDRCYPLVIEAVAEALENRQPVRVGIGVTSTDTGINRREVMQDGNIGLGFQEWGPRDPQLTFIRFEGTEGGVAQLVHLAAHPTSRGLEPSVSRDWPGVMLDRVEAVTKTKTIFINGCFGDVAPRTNWGGAVGDGEPAAQEVGLRAASDAVMAWQSIKEFRDLKLDTLTAEFELTFAPLTPLNEAERELARLEGVERTWGGDAANWEHFSAVKKAHAEPPRSGKPFQQTLTRLGPVVLVPFSGEVFAEIGLRLKKASPFEYTLCAGTSNGSDGYYPTREARGRGGYEVWVGRAYGAYLLADDIDDVLVRENLALLQKLHDEVSTAE